MTRTHAWVFPGLVAIVATLSVGIAASSHRANTAIADTPNRTQPSSEGLAHADQLSAAFEYVAETLAPSVVTIRSTKEVEVPAALQRFPDRFFFDSPLDRFFGDQFSRRFEPGPTPPARQFQQGEGSGFIVSPDGYILTNSHVVNDADEVTVTLPDDREFVADVVGTDPKTDVAVIKIDSSGLTPVQLGNSDDLRVGQWVVAAGNPFGLSSSITTGIVSATGRSRMGITDYEDFIQTDAAINRGNSGGPLVNLRGEVVGINTAILSGTGGNIGIGFAIPINMAKDVMDELIEYGRVVRGYLGAVIQDLSDGLAKSFGYDSTDGVIVTELTDDGPADKSGMARGDIITHLDGEPVTDVAQLRFHVAGIDPGTKVDVTIFRDGKPKTMKVKIEELPVEATHRPSTEGSDLNLGMTVETLASNEARRFGVDADVSGVVVTGVEPLGPAARAGLRPGDVITHVHDTAVQNQGQFRRALRKFDLSEGVRLSVQSGPRLRYVFLQIRS